MDDKVKKISEEMLEYYRKHIYECPIDILRVLYAEKDADLCAANQIISEQIDNIKELEEERDGIYADYQDLGKEKLELENVIKDLEEDCMSVYIKGVSDCNFLWRENVKKMIEDFKIISDNIREQEFPCISNDLKRNDYAVKMLEELLGDKTNGATKNN